MRDLKRAHHIVSRMLLILLGLQSMSLSFALHHDLFFFGGESAIQQHSCTDKEHHSPIDQHHSCDACVRAIQQVAIDNTAYSVMSPQLILFAFEPPACATSDGITFHLSARAPPFVIV